ncbi:response regulator [Caulobacter sp. KR2-114]|uniref:response regulator n=1 Tax=Caulobacter sp. KR2-114 TaxID=3400912 RepID=UPI003C0B0D48
MTKPIPDPRAGISPEHLAALSHEFRTPLNGVLGMTSLLDGTRLTAEQRAYVAALRESGEHLLGLVNDILDYAKLGAGKVDLATAPIEVEDVLRQVCELLSPRAHEKGLEIGWAAEAGLSPVVADAVRLKQILLNLAGNAVKFTEAGGVLILAEAAGGAGPGDWRLRFTVSDTGPGVPEAERERIFEAFAQADPSHGARLGGAGLGLAIARRLAEAMGGRLGVAGGEGRGADFWFEAAFERPAAGPAVALLRGRTVAVVSPSAIVREAAARQIEASGGRAVRAASMDEALAQTPADAVILADHALAGRGRLKPPAGRAAVILLRPAERGRIAGYRKAGFAGYLIKPLRPGSLAARVLAAAEGAASVAPLPAEDDRVAPERGPAAAPGARVLLAEDNPINAMLARTLLTREGCQVEHAPNGEAALTALAQADFDLVLMDVRMPVMGGMEATRALRARGVATPVVALTANAFEDDRRACLAAGMDDFLIKPLSPEALRGALLRWTGAGWTERRARAKLAS